MSSNSENSIISELDNTAKDNFGIKIQFPSCLPMNILNFQNNQDEKKWSGPFCFIHSADTQFGLIEKYLQHKENPRWDEEINLTTKAIQIVNEMDPKPKCFVVCGDMLDTRPGTKEEQKLRKEQYLDFIKVFKKLDPEIKLVCTCGNHDVCDIPTPESIEIYREEFGPDYFSYWVGGVKFVVLNSQYFKSPSTIPIHFEQHDKFIDTVSDPTAKHIVVMQHIPFFINDPDEDDVVYLNIEKEYRFPVMDRLIDSGVRYIFCGHYHRNAGGTYKSIDQVVTSALGGPLGSDPSGFRIVYVDKDKITHKYISVEENQELPIITPFISMSDSNIIDEKQPIDKNNTVPLPKYTVECEDEMNENKNIDLDQIK